MASSLDKFRGMTAIQIAQAFSRDEVLEALNQNKSLMELVGSTAAARQAPPRQTPPRIQSPEIDIEQGFGLGKRVGETGQDSVDVPGYTQNAPFGGFEQPQIPETQRLAVEDVDDANFQAGHTTGVMSAQQGREDRERDDLEREISIATSEIGRDQAELNFNQASAEATKNERQEIMDNLGDAFATTISSNPNLTFDEFIETNTLPGEVGSEEAEKAFNVKREEFATRLRGEENEFLYKLLQPRINADALVKNSGNLKFAMSSLVSGYNQQNGFGDVAMVIGTVRLSDPAVSVRAEDVKTIEQALAIMEKFAPEMISARMSEGDRLLPEARKRLYFQTLDLYQSQQSQIDFTLEQISADAESALPLSRRRIDNFLLPFKLPKIGEGAFGLAGRDTPALRDAVEFEMNRRATRVE